MRKLIRVLVLVMALSVYAQAGDMQNGIVNPPPAPPSAPTSDAVTANGDIQNGVTAEDESFMLTLLQALMAIY